MTEEEFNRTLKELDYVLLDVDYDKFETPLDVAKFVIVLNKINERMILEENEELKQSVTEKNSEIEELKAKLKNRNCVDCSNHGANIEVIKLKAQIEKMKCCQNCKHYKYTCENGYDCDLGVIEKWKTYHKKCNKWELAK